jgi:hypothetical protein
MKPKEYHDIVAKLLDGGHWEAVAVLWVDIFSHINQPSHVFDSVDGKAFEASSRETLRDLFALVTSVARDPEPERAYLAGLARSEIVTRVRAHFAKYGSLDALPWNVELGVAIRELLMEVWDDPDGKLLNPTRSIDPQ